MSVSTGTVDQLVTFVTILDTNLENTITNMPATPSSTDIINLQKGFQEWSVMVSAITSSAKEIGDTLKGALNKV